MLLYQKLKKQIAALDLDLKGRVVLTEAATGPYVVTPLLAAMAGAKVYAFTRSTKYGSVQDVFAFTRSSIGTDQFDALDITLVDTLNPEIIAQADVITNSGHLRPLDEEMLQYAKDGVVIPLMYEAWEWRDADMDIAYIRKRGFKVGATNERHPEVDVFSYLGDMAIKQIFDAGCCPYRNKFVLICNNDFGPFIAKTVSKLADKVGVIDLAENKEKYEGLPIDWLSDFPVIDIPGHFKDAEAIIFTAYPFDQIWIGEKAPISSSDIATAFDQPILLRYAGDVEANALHDAGIRFFPEHVSSGHMGVLPSAIGFDPIIRLQSGGLKAAEALLTGVHAFKGLPIVSLV